MMHIFIFNNASRAANYGIGSYVRLLADGLLGRSGVKVSFVDMFFGRERVFDSGRRARMPSLQGSGFVFGHGEWSLLPQCVLFFGQAYQGGG